MNLYPYPSAAPRALKPLPDKLPGAWEAYAQGAGHTFVWDEGSDGEPYQYCSDCVQYADETRENEHHGPIDCPGKPVGS